MLNMADHDLFEDLPSPITDAFNEVLYSPNIFDFCCKPPTPSGMNPSNHSSLSSPPQSITTSDLYPFDELEHDLNGIESPLTSLINNLGTTLPMNDNFQTNSLELEDEKLQILSQPKAFYRERYFCETDPRKKRAHRYIRTEDGSKHEHPTVKIPSKWRDPSLKLYIRVTSVTIITKDEPYCCCIHPYEIDTQQENVIKDRENNSLYFPINENELQAGEKSFFISRTKMIQNNLKSYETFRLFESNQPDCQRVQNIQDAKQKIAAYQLWKSQLVFTIAELQNNDSILMAMPHTSVTSIVMTDETGETPTSPTDKSKITSVNGIKCIPQQGNWEGGDEVVIIMPNPIKRKEYTIYFDFGEFGQKSVNGITRIDTKTLLFRTPSCEIPAGNDNLKVSIIIQDNKSIIPPINFYYITPIKTTINLCSCCHGNPTTKKRGWQEDKAESLISQMNQLSIDQKSNEPHSGIPSDENAKFDKYLNQLKDSLEIFVRKNDPSRLFRRTRVLLLKYDGESSPLHDAIQHGHTELALSLIEQIIDLPSPNRLLEDENENGETPLLIAVKLNQWKLIEFILKNRSDFAKQKDKDGNNLFHLLANFDEDKGVETIENILKILPTDIKNLLKEEKNQKNQTPIDIAQLHGNTQCMNLLTLIVDVEQNNNNQN